MRQRPAEAGAQINQRRLIGWAADYLLEAIFRRADRALIEEQARCDALTGLANRHMLQVPAIGLFDLLAARSVTDSEPKVFSSLRILLCGE